MVQGKCSTTCRQPCNIAHDRIALEKKCIRYAIRQLKYAGWIVTHVHDGEERYQVLTEKETLDVIFSVDESTVSVSNGDRKSWFFVVLGNGIDCIADYGTTLDDTVMDRIYKYFETLE